MNQDELDHETRLKAKWYGSIARKYQTIKPIIIKRKSAFSVYEWLKLKEILNIND